MRWRNVINRFSSQNPSLYFPVNKKREQGFLIQVISEEFYILSKEDISKAVEKCCTKMPSGVKASVFLSKLKEELNIC